MSIKGKPVKVGNLCKCTEVPVCLAFFSSRLSCPEGAGRWFIQAAAMKAEQQGTPRFSECGAAVVVYGLGAG